MNNPDLHEHPGIAQPMVGVQVRLQLIIGGNVSNPDFVGIACMEFSTERAGRQVAWVVPASDRGKKLLRAMIKSQKKAMVFGRLVYVSEADPLEAEKEVNPRIVYRGKLKWEVSNLGVCS